MNDEFDREGLQRGFDLIRNEIEAALSCVNDDQEECIRYFRKSVRSAIANYIASLVSGRTSETKNRVVNTKDWAPRALYLALMQTDMRDGLEHPSPFLGIGFELMDAYDLAVNKTLDQGEEAWSDFDARLDAFEKLLIDCRWVIR
jgi:hypothetical protein